MALVKVAEATAVVVTAMVVSAMVVTAEAVTAAEATAAKATAVVVTAGRQTLRTLSQVRRRRRCTSCRRR